MASSVLSQVQQLFDAASLGIIALDETGRIALTNPALEAMFGYQAGELIGQPLELLVPEHLRVRHAAHRQTHKQSPHARPMGMGLDIVGRRKNGQVFSIEASLSHLSLNGEKVPVAFVADISARKQAEEMRARLAAIVDSSDDAILSKTLDGTILTWNAAAERLYGYTAAEAIGQSVTMLLPSHSLDETDYLHEQVMRGEMVAHYESERVCKDGRLVHVALTVSPIIDSAHELIGLSTIARDITERKQAEAALQRQTALTQVLQTVAMAANQASSLREALQTAVDAICTWLGCPVGHALLPVEGLPNTLVSSGIWHLDGPELFVNFRASSETIQFDSGVGLPGRVLASAAPHWIEDVLTDGNFPRAAAGGEIVVRSGIAFPVLVGQEVVAVLEFFTTEPWTSDAGVLDVMANIGAQLGQVVERERSSAALRAAEQRYRRLVEQIPAIVYTASIDSHSSTTYVNQQITTVMGFTPEEWQADPELWLKQIHPDDRQMVVNDVLDLHADGNVHTTDYRAFTRDGRLVWLHDTAQVVRDEAGRPLFLQGFTLDITERKRAEAALRESEHLYRTLAHNIPNGAVFLFDHDLRYRIADGQALLARGLTSTMVEGKTLYEVLPQSFHIQEPLYRAALGGEELVTETAAGDRTFTTYYLPVRNELGEIIAGMAVSHEITERKQAEAALQEERALLARRVEERTADLSAANAALARAARLKDEFLASMSHELRTPLNAVLGLSEALREGAYGSMNADQDRALQTVEESGRHLLNLINDILDLAKIGADKLDLAIEQVSVEQIAQASLRMVRQVAQKKQLAVKLQLDSQAQSVQVDARRLKQILVNLLSNAVKFTPNGGAIGLEVSLDASLEQIRFAVWDTGIGIASEHMEQLFQPFVQLDSRLARQYEGSGLGLALVYRMVELHGGSIGVSSEVGKGSRFTVSLPWQATNTAPAPATAGIDHAIRKALIIEDSLMAAEQAVRYLSEMNIGTEVLSHGEGAAERVAALKPDLVILDILLPDISGWDVLTKLKADERTSAIPIIILSMVDDQQRGYSLGATAHIVKPYTRADIYQAIADLATHASPSPRSAPPSTLPTILLAEDNEASIMTFVDYLSAVGYRVVVARNGVEALIRAGEERPALILMDIQMPEMDGIEATRHIRADPLLAETPIIALTALAMPGDRERCITAGVNDYLAKPIGLRTLTQAIANVLQGQRSTQASLAPASRGDL